MVTLTSSSKSTLGSRAALPPLPPLPVDPPGMGLGMRAGSEDSLPPRLRNP